MKVADAPIPDGKLILVVDDEQDILELVEYNLAKQGYRVMLTDNGAQALTLVRDHKPDLILLDIMMPDMDGHQVCTKLKSDQRFSHIPIIFLTARSDEMTEIRGLDEGADDYITKPVSISKLISRINAILRRIRMPDEMSGNVIEVRDLEIDRERYVVQKGDKEIQLPRKEFELLFLLAANAGKVLSRDILLNKIWGSDVYVLDRTVDVHIRKIREKIGEGYIDTVKGVGYRFKKR